MLEKITFERNFACYAFLSVFDRKDVKVSSTSQLKIWLMKIFVKKRWILRDLMQVFAKNLFH